MKGVALVVSEVVAAELSTLFKRFMGSNLSSTNKHADQTSQRSFYKDTSSQSVAGILEAWQIAAKSLLG
jgi:hypothetical protein